MEQELGVLSAAQAGTGHLRKWCGHKNVKWPHTEPGGSPGKNESDLLGHIIKGDKHLRRKNILKLPPTLAASVDSKSTISGANVISCKIKCVSSLHCENQAEIAARLQQRDLHKHMSKSNLVWASSSISALQPHEII